ncbi:MAG: glycoside hydrolase family 92 protein, partial [Cyclobacteriaceae bacterium]
WMPIFPCWNNYTSAMIGDHATVMISDAYTKGITGFDTEKAWKYMAKNAFTHNDDTTSYRLGKGRRAMDTYLKYGYLPMEEKVPDAFHKEEQVSRTLEYAFDDFATGRFAGAIQKPDAFVALMDRSKNYIHVFDTTTGYVRGRHDDGRWFEPFDPNDTHATFITEGTPYQYTWFVPHDMYGLMKLMGGEKAFEDKLDGLFNGGHYWHGNEPGHQIPYLYNYIGKPWKTQKIVHDIVREEYSTGPGGLSGNEDAGQMSAWLVFSMMGLYPVCPSTPEYIMGKPFFEEITIHYDHGKPLTILTKNLSDINIYVQSITLNQQPYPLSRIMHEDLLKGGVMEIVMGPEPASDRAVKREFRPMSWND